MSKQKFVVVGVISNKGGCGKSLLTTSIAYKLSKMGLKVGLLDTDVDSPTVPRMLGMKDVCFDSSAETIKPVQFSPNLSFISIASHPCIIGNRPTVWRGEKHREYLTKCITEVDWGNIDLMLCDYTAGIGDAPIALNKFFGYMDGLVFVSIPSKVSTDSCERAINMAKRLKMPMLGMVENMAYFVCDKCGSRHNIYGNSGAKELAERYDIEFLGEIPILSEIAMCNDGGKPIDNEVITRAALKIIQSNDKLSKRVKEG